MANHGVNVSQQATSVSTPVVAESGVPFVVGAAPVQSAASPAQEIDFILEYDTSYVTSALQA